MCRIGFGGGLRSVFMQAGMIFIFSAGIQPSAAQTPRALDDRIAIESFLTVENNCVRIAYDASSGNLFYSRESGQIYEIDMGGPVKTLVASENDHGIGFAWGFNVANDGTLFLVGNQREDGFNVGIIRRGKRNGDGFAWTTVAETEPHKLHENFNHFFNAIAINPEQTYLFVNSGSRTDHGEDQDGDGNREFPITAVILRLPIDGENLILYNDADSLKKNGYLFAQGVRNHFDLAFDSEGELFGVENSGDRDDPEEMNWIREGHHYGFPWRMGKNNTPQQFPGYNPLTDPLLRESAWAFSLGYFHDDPGYPSPPDGVTFTDPIVNIGPDADIYVDESGNYKDASMESAEIATFTPHRSPLGLVFDVQNRMLDEFRGSAFTLSNSNGGAPLGDPSRDLLHLVLMKNASEDNYTLRSTRIVEGFSGPVDAAQVDNVLYVLENGARTIWQLTFTGLATSAYLPENPRTFSLSQNHPNPFNPETRIQFHTEKPGEFNLEVFNIQGEQVRTILENKWLDAGVHSVVLQLNDKASGVYYYVLSNGTQRHIRKMLLIQ